MDLLELWKDESTREPLIYGLALIGAICLGIMRIVYKKLVPKGKPRKIHFEFTME